MIVSVEQLRFYGEFSKYTDEELKDRLDALESLVRSYTNNNFQNRNIRVYCSSENNVLVCDTTYFKVGDTVQISNSKVNDGLYVIESINSRGLVLDGSVFDIDRQTVTKFEYPKAVVNAIVDMLKWESQYGDKRGIQSESIGRHSVTYVTQTDDNSFGGYPRALFNALNQYQKARF